MRSIRQVLKQAWEAKLSQDEVHRSCGISKGAVNRYLKLAQSAGLSWPLPEELDDVALERLLRAKTKPHSGLAGARPGTAPRQERL